MQEEFANLDFNSARLEKRFIKTMETLAGQPDKSIRFSSENRAGAKGIYRMLSNDGLDREKIMQARREAAARRTVESEKTILAVQDTAGLNYDTQTKMEGIGYICEQASGVNIHSCLAVTEDGSALGVLGQSPYNRKQPAGSARAHESKKVRLLEEKESYRRMQTLGRSATGLPEQANVAAVCGREGDMAG
jgi:hypothetical protein